MIYFLTGYVAFEEFILKFLPVSDVIYSYLRFFGEMLIYVAFGKLVIHKLYRGIPFVKTAIDLPVIGFYSVVLLSMLVNGSPTDREPLQYPSICAIYRSFLFGCEF